jgi:hypothetical protein
MIPSRRTLLTGLGVMVGAVSGLGRGAAAAAPFTYSGRLTQGGCLIGKTTPGAHTSVNGESIDRASEGGYFLVGFDRDEPRAVDIGVNRAGRWEEMRLGIAPVDYDVQRIDGLPPNQVEPTDPVLLERIAREARLKQAAFLSNDPADGFKDGFDWPVQKARRTARFGGQRILNGVPNTPHYGVDLAVPIGTPIRAPADGLVVLAEPDMHFEGGLTFVDHGQGLVGMFLHQSEIRVAVGQRVRRGELIGVSGAKGRVTGPHLCWRLKWRGRNLDPSLLVGVSRPA